MLSYDKAVSVNGNPASPTALSSPRLAVMGTNPKPMSNTTMTHATAISQTGGAAPHHRHIWLVTGPAGCGKSTVAQYLANTLGLPYLEGDEV